MKWQVPNLIGASLVCSITRDSIGEFSNAWTHFYMPPRGIGRHREALARVVRGIWRRKRMPDDACTVTNWKVLDVLCVVTSIEVFCS